MTSRRQVRVHKEKEEGAPAGWRGEQGGRLGPLHILAGYTAQNQALIGLENLNAELKTGRLKDDESTGPRGEVDPIIPNVLLQCRRVSEVIENA